MEDQNEWDFFCKKNEDKTTILAKIQTIGNEALRRQDWSDTSNACKDLLRDVAAYLGATNFQTAFFVAVFFNIEFHGSARANFESIKDFFCVKQISLMKHKNEIYQMRRKGLISFYSCASSRYERWRYGEEDYEEDYSFANARFTIPDAIAQAIIEGQPLPQIKKVQTPADFLEKINRSIKNYSRNELRAFFDETVLLEEECGEFVESVKSACKRIPEISERVLFYFICFDSVVDGRGCSELSERISLLSENSLMQNRVLKNLLVDEDDEDPQKSILLKEKLIEIGEARMAQDATARPTDAGLDLMFGKDSSLYKRKNKSTDLIEHEKITSRELFFNDKTSKQIERIKNSLEEEKFSSIQERLKEKGMAQGIAALFYGPPGTGKTESVQQLARLTGRDIYHVDISQTKTKWYGESPKLVKRIFAKYKTFCDDAKKDGKQIPILLFNEADAIISKRKDVTSDTSECDKESNTIQNIVLEQMEKLEGIMIATTNLADNMDAAFERRFLFKVEFQKPDIEGRTKIWQSKLKGLCKSDASQIASDYDFSGGEIDNISRKVELEEVISGIAPDVAKIREFCQTEKINSENARVIGFGV